MSKILRSDNVALRAILMEPLSPTGRRNGIGAVGRGFDLRAGQITRTVSQ